MTDSALLKSTVVEGGYCVGCGACAAVPGSPVTMKMDEAGRLQARFDGVDEARTSLRAVCPFSDLAVNENIIGEALFAKEGAQPDARVGWYRDVWAGYVSEGDFRKRGSSGGMGNWLAAELLSSGEVDAVVHVRPDIDGRLFGFTISRSTVELKAGSKSRYYPVEMSSVFKEMRDNPGRYALVGVPCFIKAARLMARNDAVIDQGLRYTISLVCGHLKSDGFAKMFGWQLGILPNRLRAIDFRVKNDDGRANQYSITASGEDAAGQDVTRTRQNKDFFGYLWSHGLFKYRACDYCDDVFGETADVTVGDAWLPGLVDDPRGTNVVVSRNPRISALIEAGLASGRLTLDTITADAAAKSQDAGLRHRRQGLAVRLARARRKGRWAPPKRVQPEAAKEIEYRQRLVYETRETLSERSHDAFSKAVKTGSFETFKAEVSPLMKFHDFINQHKTLKSMVRAIVKPKRG